MLISILSKKCDRLPYFIRVNNIKRDFSIKKVLDEANERIINLVRSKRNFVFYARLDGCIYKVVKSRKEKPTKRTGIKEKKEEYRDNFKWPVGPHRVHHTKNNVH